jgi:hypothetical protein
MNEPLQTRSKRVNSAQGHSVPFRDMNIPFYVLCPDLKKFVHIEEPHPTTMPKSLADPKDWLTGFGFPGPGNWEGM